MSGWVLSKFKDHFSIGLRNGLNKPSRVRGSGVRMVNMKEIFGYDFIDDKTPMELVPVTDKEFELSNLEYGDLLFARQSLTEAGAGKVALYRGSQPTVFESHLIRCRINKQKSDPTFLYYLFKSPLGKGAVSTIVHQVAAAGIKGSDLQELEFLFPTTEEQKAIASILSSLDDKIDLLHRQNATLERMAETLFRQWFAEESQEDWDEKRIGDLVKVIDNRGKTPPYTDIPSAYPLIEVNALTGNNRLVDYSVIRKFVDGQTFKTWFRGHPKKYDSLLSTVGSIGEISMFLVEKGSIAQNVIALSAVNICPIYLFEALKSIKDEIKELDIGSVQPSIKVPHLLSLKIKIPSKDKMDNFSTIVKSQLSKMVVNYHQIQTLEKLRDNLLPKLMSGEIQVS